MTLITRRLFPRPPVLPFPHVRTRPAAHPEIFYSLQGESSTAGYPTVFVRLTGCPLRCSYCDTAYAFTGGEAMSLTDILERTAAYNTRYVTVTGGEPLAQKNCLPLLSQLANAGYQVSLETSGALDIAPVDPRVLKVMDLKTPGSGEMQRNRYANLDHLAPPDQIKFIICDRDDYEVDEGGNPRR